MTSCLQVGNQDRCRGKPSSRLDQTGEIKLNSAASGTRVIQTFGDVDPNTPSISTLVSTWSVPRPCTSAFPEARRTEAVATRCRIIGEIMIVNCTKGMRRILSSRNNSRMRRRTMVSEGRELIKQKRIGPWACILA
jgi:hypothetical protein